MPTKPTGRVRQMHPPQRPRPSSPQAGARYQVDISRSGDSYPMSSSAIAATGPREAYGDTMILNDEAMRNGALTIDRTPFRSADQK